MAVSVAAALLKPAVTTLAFESAQRYLHAYVERKGRGDDTRHEELRYVEGEGKHNITSLHEDLND